MIVLKAMFDLDIVYGIQRYFFEKCYLGYKIDWMKNLDTTSKWNSLKIFPQDNHCNDSINIDSSIEAIIPVKNLMRLRNE